MKELFSKRHILIASGIGLLILLFFSLGFRITYAPALENSWDAISAVATWVSVVLSGVAIYFAVLIPKKIANQQNRIALFERRLDFYNVLIIGITFADLIRNSSQNQKEIWLYFNSAFGGKDSEDYAVIDWRKIKNNALALYNYQVYPILNQGEFLFDASVSDQIELFRSTLFDLISCDSKHFSNSFNRYISAVHEVKEVAVPIIAETLLLTKE